MNEQTNPQPNPKEEVPTPVSEKQDKSTPEEPENPATPEPDDASSASAEAEGSPVTQEQVEIPEGEIQRVQSTHVQQLSWWQKMVPGKKRDAQLADLQTGYAEVLGLVRSMRDNLDAQVIGQKKLVEFMSELPGVAEGLRHVGEAAQQQKEMLGVIKDQMETNTVQNANIVTSMDKFNNTLYSMDDTTRKILEGARDTEDSLKEMLERSERRLMWMTSLAIILLLGIGAGIFYLFYDGKLMVGPYAQQSAPAVVPATVEATATPERKTAVLTITDFKTVEWNKSTGQFVEPALGDATNETESAEAETPETPETPVDQVATQAVEEVSAEADEGVKLDPPRKKKKWFNINLFGKKDKKEDVPEEESPAESSDAEEAEQIEEEPSDNGEAEATDAEPEEDAEDADADEDPAEAPEELPADS